MSKQLPPFVQEYLAEGAKFYFNTGSPIKGNIVYKFLLTVCAADTISEPEYDTFLILEGYLHSAEIEPDQYPSIAYYLNLRSHADLPALWEAYQHIHNDELIAIRNGFYTTRRHAMETLASLPEEEKKSDSTPSLTSTSKAPKSRATATKK